MKFIQVAYFWYGIFMLAGAAICNILLAYYLKWVGGM